MPNKLPAIEVSGPESEQTPDVRVRQFGPGTPILPELNYRTSSHSIITALRLAIGLVAILGATVLPPAYAGIFRILPADYLDFVKWAVTVEVAALAVALAVSFF